ncbi:MAG TPA: Maf family protein [Anaerolineae bacterium]
MDDLEQFWSNIFSEDPALIAEAWSSLDAAKREAVTSHLRAIAADPARHPDQRRAAKAALSIPHPPSPSPEHSSREGERGGEVVLASGSPRRRELIALLGLPFTTINAGVDETPHPGEDPAAMVARLSLEKARAAQRASHDSPLPNHPTILITADTTVSLNGEALGKPVDAAEARSILARLRGRVHQVFTAITLVDLMTDQLIADLASTDVPMRDYTDDEMNAYIATGDPFDKAGSYAIQHNGFNPVANLRGCYANVVGLPLCHVTRALRALGIDPLVDVPSACQAHLRYECPVYQSILARRET